MLTPIQHGKLLPLQIVSLSDTDAEGREPGINVAGEIGNAWWKTKTGISVSRCNIFLLFAAHN